MAQILGLDIDNDALYGVLLKVAFRKAELQRYVRVPLAAAPDSPARTPELKDAMQGMLRTLGVSPDVVITALHGEDVSLKVLSLPLAAAKRIGEVLPFELESQLPFELESAVIDHQPIDQRNGELRLLAAAVPNERIASVLEGLAAAGIDPRELAAGAAALDGIVGLVPELRAPGATCLIDLGGSRTDVCLFADGHLELARTLSVGLDDLPGQADVLWRGVQHTVAIYRASGGEAPARIYLGGSGASAQGAREWLQSKLETEVLPVPMPQAPGLDEHDGTAFLRAAALAGRHAGPGRHINLRSGAFTHRQSAGDLSQYTNLAVGCVVAVLLSSMFALKSQQLLLLDENAALQERLGTATQQIFGKTVSDPELVDALIKSQKSGDPLPRFDAFDALAVISAAVKEGIVHEVRRLRIEVEGEKHEGRIELQGALGSIEERDTVVAELEKHECIKDIERGKTSPAPGQSQINYQLEATIRCPGEAVPDEKSSKRSQ
jgi:general secretion pathway protein L